MTLLQIILAWWFWLPIVIILGVLTYRNKKQAEKIIAEREKAHKKTVEAQNHHSSDKPRAGAPKTASNANLADTVPESFLANLSLRGIHKQKSKIKKK